MFKSLAFFLFFCAPIAFGQEITSDLAFIEEQKTQALPFQIPLFVDLGGNLNIITKNFETAASFRPNLEVAWKKTKSLYIKPIQRSSFSIARQDENMEWIEVKRKRWELGLGLGAIMNQTLPASISLTPFKGSRQVMIRQLKASDEVTEDPTLPQKLSDVKSWKVGDQGTFQTYGGVHVTAGVNFSVVNIFSVGVTIQNIFNIEVTKIGAEHILLSIAEDNVKNRRFQSGASVVVGALNVFKGKRLSTQFVLDMTNAKHEELYENAIHGDLSKLQSSLPESAQRMDWKGFERVGFIGVPVVAGKYFSRSEVKSMSNGETNILDTKKRNSSGIFLPLRNHNKLVYQTKDTITLFWYSEMLKTDDEVFTRKFLTPGHAMGVRGFGQTLPEGTKLGSTLAQMGLSFTKTELQNVSPEKLEEILGFFKARCEQMDLSCAKKKNYQKIAKTLRGFLIEKWGDVQDKLGFLMLEEPALIHSYVKSIKSHKTVYFKFLNEKFQSMEGYAPIEI